jgi:hypothetical protein
MLEGALVFLNFDSLILEDWTLLFFLKKKVIINNNNNNNKKKKKILPPLGLSLDPRFLRGDGGYFNQG